MDEQKKGALLAATVLADEFAEPKAVFRLLKLSDGGGYKACKRGDIPVTFIGEKMLVRCRDLKRKLQIGEFDVLSSADTEAVRSAMKTLAHRDAERMGAGSK